jgi:hypothetical protein
MQKLCKKKKTLPKQKLKNKLRLTRTRPLNTKKARRTQKKIPDKIVNVNTKLLKKTLLMSRNLLRQFQESKNQMDFLTSLVLENLMSIAWASWRPRMTMHNKKELSFPALLVMNKDHLKLMLPFLGQELQNWQTPHQNPLLKRITTR